jgi:autotransporter passenger strand-loop-strand repeat protein
MTTVSSGNTLNVTSGQTSDGVIVLSGGQLNVLSGGTHQVMLHSIRLPSTWVASANALMRAALR